MKRTIPQRLRWLLGRGTGPARARLVLFSTAVIAVLSLAVDATTSAAADEPRKGALPEEDVARARGVAMAALPNYLPAASPRTLEQLLGQGRQIDMASFELDKPVPQIRIGLSELLRAQDSLETLLDKTPEVLRWPVTHRNRGEMTSSRLSLQTKKIKGEWRAIELDDSIISLRVITIRNNYAKRMNKPEGEFLLMEVPFTHSYYVGYQDRNEKMLIPVLDQKGVEFRAGRAVAAQHVMTWLRTEAMKQSRVRKEMQAEGHDAIAPGT